MLGLVITTVDVGIIYYYLGKKFKSWLTTFLLCTVLDLLVLQNAVSSGGKIFVKKEENIMRQHFDGKGKSKYTGIIQGKV
jgi:hypothetical protein